MSKFLPSNLFLKLLKVLLMDELEKKRELLVERDDYAGTGANNHHDPKPPGSQWGSKN